jgi:3-oxoacyl-[acyl-carrier-protein] synthase-3
VAAEDVDLIIMCTSSPDDAFGGACLLQGALGAHGSIAFDLTAACSGFVVGLVTATQYIRSGMYRNVLLVGADALSRYVDWRDRGTCILFGDGAGAVLLRGEPGAGCSLLGYDMHSDGTGNKHLRCPVLATDAKAMAADGGSSAATAFANISMNGQDVFKFAVRAVPASLSLSLAAAGLPPSAVDWYVLHQANQRILDAVAQRLEVDDSRMVSTIARYGNTSAASIPLALDSAVRSGAIQPGQLLGFAGFGAGLTWATAVVRWR